MELYPKKSVSKHIILLCTHNAAYFQGHLILNHSLFGRYVYTSIHQNILQSFLKDTNKFTL